MHFTYRFELTDMVDVPGRPGGPEPTRELASGYLIEACKSAKAGPTRPKPGDNKWEVTCRDKNALMIYSMMKHPLEKYRI
jgi:hypothetical protein